MDVYEHIRLTPFLFESILKLFSMPIDISAIKADTLYLVVDVAKILEVAEATVRSYLNDGSLKGVKNKKGKWRVYGRDIIRFVNEK